MFYNAYRFNHDIGDWDTKNVTHMDSMFWNASAFNQDIGLWTTGQVEDMDRMFYQAASFNQDLQAWCVDKHPTEPTWFSKDAISWTLPHPVWGRCLEEVTEA